ncbi:hypothetical protein BGZ65_008141, partial [Modicella reniformis]
MPNDHVLDVPEFPLDKHRFYVAGGVTQGSSNKCEVLFEYLVSSGRRQSAKLVISDKQFVPTAFEKTNPDVELFCKILDKEIKVGDEVLITGSIRFHACNIRRDNNKLQQYQRLIITKYEIGRKTYLLSKRFPDKNEAPNPPPQVHSTDNWIKAVNLHNRGILPQGSTGMNNAIIGTTSSLATDKSGQFLDQFNDMGLETDFDDNLSDLHEIEDNDERLDDSRRARKRHRTDEEDDTPTNLPRNVLPEAEQPFNVVVGNMAEQAADQSSIFRDRTLIMSETSSPRPTSSPPSSELLAYDQPNRVTCPRCTHKFTHDMISQ